MATFSSIFIRALFDRIVQQMEGIYDKYIIELDKQGHIDTGKLASTGQIETQFIPLGIRSTLLLESYYEYLERRLDPQHIPFQRGSGKKTSKLVQALFRYFQRKGATDFKAATFATINKWKKEGRPTKASLRFSSVGTRIRPLSRVLEDLDVSVETMFTLAGEKALDEVIINMAENTRRAIQ